MKIGSNDEPNWRIDLGAQVPGVPRLDHPPADSERGLPFGTLLAAVDQNDLFVAARYRPLRHSPYGV
jgi:hypothetical protein